jgi:UDP-perosamine 4-acetyltransferase
MNDNSKIPKPVIVLGAGGHAKVLIEALRQSGRKIAGVTDPEKTAGEEYFGATVLKDDDAVLNVSPDEVELVNGIGAMPGKDLRWRLAERMEGEGYSFSQVIPPLCHHG